MLWTRLHVYVIIPTIIVSIIVSYILAFSLKDKDEKKKMIPITVVTVVLLLLEVWKQARGFVVGYDLYWLPFHFCSLFLYTLPLIAFYNGKYKEGVRVLAGTVAACLFMFMVVYPDVVYGENAIISCYKYITKQGGGFSEFHSVFFHGIALFAYFLFAIQNICKFDTKRDLKIIVLFFVGYCVIVGTLSQLIKTNFNNFYHSNAPFIEPIRESMIDKWGYFGQIVYILMVSAGTIIVPILSYFVLRGMSFLNKKYIVKEKENK